MADLEEMCCFECEQTIKPSGCTRVGVCTKTAVVAALQDLLIAACSYSRAPDSRLVKWIFSTLTNVNFDEQWFLENLKEASQTIDDNEWEAAYQKACEGDMKPIRLAYSPDACLKKHGATLGGLRQFGIQGVKGACAYAEHVYEAVAFIGGEPDSEFIKAVRDMLDEFRFLCSGACDDVDILASHLLNVGLVNKTIVLALDKCNQLVGQGQKLVDVTNKPKIGHCVLVSGHDYAILAQIVEACKPHKINVYTHGELFAASSFNRFSCLAGNFGGAWYKQQTEFARFPGPIVLTSNCLMRPSQAYAERVFSASVVGHPGVKSFDLKKIVDLALEMPGFTSEEQCEQAVKDCGVLHTVKAVGLSNTVFQGYKSALIDLLKTGQIERLIFIGGCDGHNSDRSKFRQKALESGPKDLLLTAACGRFRINDYDFGTIGGLPRLIDVGQCNDVISLLLILAQIAPEVPDILSRLSLYVSWYEQKAVVQLLMLLSQGVTGIQIGPTAPVALTTDALGYLNAKFGLELIH